ncbi:hypothetical protein K0817_016755 [Microbacterium sp. HD4P20]|uniref:hypothetical protein n=1 Tax=Microbacterium sp. HD4P20 TaxID=2864874 RepID=UPI001C63F5D7|nr:hypothetical protein [Microbacterium sp. HD4P20]MCP2638206.1 hypothetical protein [Microbacterium sp. HD4P20]
MRGLVLAELRTGWAAWIGVVLLGAVLALSSGVGLSAFETGLREGGDVQEAYSTLAVTILLFAVPSGIAVVGAVARLSVDLGRATYARWQLAGVAPAQASGVVFAQLAASGFAGGILGFALTPVVAGPLVRAGFESGSLFAEMDILTGPLTFAITIPLTTAVAIAGGLRAARGAGHGSPLAALREPETRAKRMRWWRWVLLLLVTFGAALGLASVLGAQDRASYMSQSVLIPVYLTIPLLAAGPAIYPLTLRAWTALLPASMSSSWYLARHQARYHLSRSTASITPLFAGTALVGGLFTMAATTNASFHAGGESLARLSVPQVLLISGGPIALAAVGAAVVVFMSNRTQGHEQALLRAGGASDATVLGSALLQALIHVTTALVLAMTVLVATAFVSATALARFTTAVPVLDIGVAGPVALVGLCLTVLATTVPAAVRLREPVAVRLAVA